LRADKKEEKEKGKERKGKGGNVRTRTGDGKKGGGEKTEDTRNIPQMSTEGNTKIVKGRGEGENRGRSPTEVKKA